MTNSLIRSRRDRAVTGFRHRVLLATTDEVAGRRVKRVIGIVRGNSIRARHVGRDILAGLRSIVGGELSDYTKLMGEAREQALDRMADQALTEGANAVVGLRFSTSMVISGAAELLAYGTAVELE